MEIIACAIIGLIVVLFVTPLLFGDGQGLDMRKFTSKLSAKLDYAVYRSEKYGGVWRLWRRALEWWIFGGRL